MSLTEKTVLLLGAGASIEYGYPSAAELRSEIIKGILQGNGLRSILVGTMGHTEELALEFGRALARSSQASVDAFLERRREFLKVGRQSIAAVLMQREHERNLYRTADAKWYDWLWDRLDNGTDGFVDHEITVVTFNYDRSLEQYLGWALRNSYSIDYEAIRTQLETLKFIHVYGTIGGRPFLENDARPYEVNLSSPEIVKSANSIKIVDRDEAVADDPAIKQAVEAISQAKHLYFLGFSYDETNLQRLEISNAQERGRLTFGTLHGFTLNEALGIEQRIGLSAPPMRDIVNGRVGLRKSPLEMDCLEFLRHYAQF